MPQAAVLLLILIVAVPVTFVDWFAGLPGPEQVPVGIGVLAFLTLVGYLIWAAWRERQRKKREYRQALLEFRWREDMSPIEFERCCADYLGLRGWDARTTKASGDQGADVVARKASHLLVLQCKKYGRPVGNKAVQEVIAARAYQQATAAAVVSNQTYTPAARELAERAGIFLLHFTELRNVDRLLGLPEYSQEAAGPEKDEALRRQMAPASSLPNSSVVRTCPNCGASMRLPGGRSGMVRCPACKQLYPART